MVCRVPKCGFFWLVAVLFLTGTPNGLFGQLLYVGNAGDDTLSSYVIDQDTGALTELLPRVTTPGSPSSVAIHQSGKFVYVTNGGNPALGVNGPSIAAFSINPDTGALTLLSSVPLTPGSGPQGAVIDPSGKFLLIANGGTSNVTVFSIDPSTGALSPVPGSPFALPQSQPSRVLVHPNGKFVYVSEGSVGEIAAFNLAANGALTPIAGSSFPARMNLSWMAMDAAGKFLFGVERQDNAVLVYSVNATTGALTQVGSPFPAGGGVSGVAVDPAGKFLYVSNTGASSITVFSIGPTGALTQGRFFPAILGAFDVILDPSGKFLYTAGQNANALGAYAIDPSSGALTPLAQQFVPAGVRPVRGASILLSPPVIPPIRAEGVFNFFSVTIPGMPNSGIARGSRLAISGANIGPAVEVSGDIPLQRELGGASIQIQSGDVTTAAIMVYASSGFVTGVVPSTTPLGDATVTVTYKGRSTSPLPVTIVNTSPGIRTLNSEGSGPARALNANPDTVVTLEAILNGANLPSNALNLSAKPGQRMVLQAMGLGPVTFDETQLSSQDLDVPLDVIVGNKLATVISKLRIIDGNDLILIQLPADAPEGCYVPVAVRAGGVTSNVASISISATGASCSDPAGLSASDIELAQKSGQLNVGSIQVTHFDLGQAGTDNEAQAAFGRYNFNSLLSAFTPGTTQSGIRQAIPTPPLGTCAVSPGTPTRSGIFDLKDDPTHPQFLTVGQALTLRGPNGPAQLMAPDYHFGSDDNVITPGDYAVDNGTGTPAFGPFKAVLNLPPMVTWTNKDTFGSSLDSTQDLTVTWSGGISDKEFVFVVGLSANHQAAMGFFCAEKASAGKFTVPAWVLSSIPKSDLFTNGDQSMQGGLLGVGTAPFTSAARFTAPGLDFGVFTYEQATINIIPYR